METTKCRICLGENMHMHTIVNTDLQFIYEKLTEHLFDVEGKPLVTCYICTARLKNCQQLMQKCCRSEEILNQMLSGVQIDKETINDQLSNYKTMSVTSMLKVSISDLVDVDAEVKEEIIESDSDKNDSNSTENNNEVTQEPSPELNDEVDSSHLVKAIVSKEVETGRDASPEPSRVESDSQIIQQDHEYAMSEPVSTNCEQSLEGDRTESSRTPDLYYEEEEFHVPDHVVTEVEVYTEEDMDSENVEVYTTLQDEEISGCDVTEDWSKEAPAQRESSPSTDHQENETQESNETEMPSTMEIKVHLESPDSPEPECRRSESQESEIRLFMEEDSYSESPDSPEPELKGFDIPKPNEIFQNSTTPVDSSHQEKEAQTSSVMEKLLAEITEIHRERNKTPESSRIEAHTQTPKKVTIDVKNTKESLLSSLTSPTRNQTEIETQSLHITEPMLSDSNEGLSPKPKRIEIEIEPKTSSQTKTKPFVEPVRKSMRREAQRAKTLNVKNTKRDNNSKEQTRKVETNGSDEVNTSKDESTHERRSSNDPVTKQSPHKLDTPKTEIIKPKRNKTELLNTEIRRDRKRKLDTVTDEPRSRRNEITENSAHKKEAFKDCSKRNSKSAENIPPITSENKDQRHKNRTHNSDTIKKRMDNDKTSNNKEADETFQNETRNRAELNKDENPKKLTHNIASRNNKTNHDETPKTTSENISKHYTRRVETRRHNKIKEEKRDPIIRNKRKVLRKPKPDEIASSRILFNILGIPISQQRQRNKPSENTLNHLVGNAECNKRNSKSVENIPPITSENPDNDDKNTYDTAVNDFNLDHFMNYDHTINTDPTYSLPQKSTPRPYRYKNKTCKEMFDCHLCDFSTNRKRFLLAHIRLHTGGRPHKCHMCDSSFRIKQALENHIRTHTGEKPFECDICHKGFKVKHHVVTHMRTHTGEKPYKCFICMTSFARSDNLKAHVYNHTGIKPYKCKICKQRFTEPKNLKSHMRKHTGEKPYQCDNCEKCYKDRNSLTYHIRKQLCQKK